MPNRYSEYLLTRGAASGGGALLAYQQEKKSSAVKNYFPLPDFIFFPISVTARCFNHQRSFNIRQRKPSKYKMDFKKKVFAQSLSYF